MTDSRCLVLLSVFLFLGGFAVTPSPLDAQELTHRPDAISGGAAAGLNPVRLTEIPPPADAEGDGLLDPKTFIPGVGFVGYNFLTNANETGGFVFIPPDPIGAAGTDRLLAVVNVGIECKTKTGALLFQDSLQDFFSPLGGATLGTFTFDPKVVWDPYENRFLVVTLERWFLSQGDPSNESRILVAVSKTATPATATAADWWYMAIDSKITVQGRSYWADYPGFEVDEEAVYITNNMFPFTTGTARVRLWIIDKGTVGGFYAGGTPSWNIHDPITGGATELTMMPAKVFSGIGGGGVSPSGVGTYLVGYSSLTTGGPGGLEALQLIRVNNPLGSVSFTFENVFMGDIEDVGRIYGFPDIPDGPQLGEPTGIEVNDSRIYDAVWRDNSLWATTTINPNTVYDATNAGEATAHWVRINTSAVTGGGSAAGLLTLADQGNIGGEDIASSTSTFFPSVAVNHLGQVQFGFAATAATMYCGAYFAGREPGDPAGTVQASGLVRAGEAPYLRLFSDPRNRWGDYSGMSVDPADERIFWAFNEYAWTQGTPAGTGLGRWRTAWRACAVSCFDLICPPDQGVARNQVVNLEFCIVNCGGLAEDFDYTLSDDLGWCTPVANTVNVAAGDTVCINLQCIVPGDACPPDTTEIEFQVTSSVGEVTTCFTYLGTSNNPPVAVCKNVNVVGSTVAPCSVGVAAVDLDDGTTDPDGDPFALTLDPPGPYPEGVNAVHFIATDTCGAADTCAATITVTCLIGPVLELIPPTLVLGTVAAGDTVCDSIHVANVGDLPLTIGSVTGCGSMGFFLDLTPLTSPIAPGDTSRIVACFTPEMAGAQSCTVVVNSDGGSDTTEVVVTNTTSVPGDDLEGHRLLLATRPNPFGSATSIRFTLPEETSVRLEVFDSQGRRVRILASGDTWAPGVYEESWDGRSDLGVGTGAGVYFVRLTAGKQTRVTRAVKLE